ARVPPERTAAADRAIWVVVERRPDGSLTEGTTELLGHAAIALADPLCAEVIAVQLGPGDDALLTLDHPVLAGYTNEGWSAAIAHAIEEKRPAIVLFSSTERGRDFAPRIAAKLALGLTGDAIDLEIDQEGRLIAMKPAF